MKHNSKIKQVVHYSDRCTVCGTMFTRSSVSDLKAVVKAHKTEHKQQISKVRAVSGGLKFRLCTKCNKGFYGSKKGLCTRCFEISKGKRR